MPRRPALQVRTLVILLAVSLTVVFVRLSLVELTATSVTKKFPSVFRSSAFYNSLSLLPQYVYEGFFL